MNKDIKKETINSLTMVRNYNQLPNDDDKFNHLDFISQILWTAIVNKTKTDISNDKFVRNENKVGCTFPYNYAEKLYGSNITKYKFTKAIKELEDNGYLIVVRGNKKGFCNKYFPVMPETKNEQIADNLFDKLPNPIREAINKLTSHLPERPAKHYEKFPKVFIQTYSDTYNKLLKDYGSFTAVNLFVDYVDQLVEGKKSNLMSKFNYNTMEYDNEIFQSFIKEQRPEKIETKKEAKVEEPEQEKKETNYKPSEEKTYVEGYDVSDFTDGQIEDFKDLCEEFPNKKQEIFDRFSEDFTATYYQVKSYLIDDEEDDVSETTDEKVKYMMNHPEEWF